MGGGWEARGGGVVSLGTDCGETWISQGVGHMPGVGGRGGSSPPCLLGDFILLDDGIVIRDEGILMKSYWLGRRVADPWTCVLRNFGSFLSRVLGCGCGAGFFCRSFLRNIPVTAPGAH